MELDENTTIEKIKQEIQQDFQMPASRTKILFSGKVLGDDVALSSLKRRKVQFMVMGVKPSSELSQMTVEDCISSSLAFMTLEEIQICRQVSKAWNEMCLRGSLKNRDRYTFLNDGRTCFDLLMHSIKYVLPQSIIGRKEMTSIESPYIHDYFIVYTKQGSVKKRVYTGAEKVFILNPSDTRDEVFQVIDVPTGNIVLRFSDSAFQSIKPIDVKMKQEMAFKTFKRELLIEKGKERKERLKEKFNEEMKLQKTILNSLEWQQKLIEFQNEANDLKSYEESSEFQGILEIEKRKFFKDELVFAFYDSATKNIIMQFSNYLVSLDDISGRVKSFVTLTRKIPETNRSSAREDLEEVTSPLLPLERFYVLKTVTHNVILLDRNSLKVVTVLSDHPEIDYFISPICTDDQTYLLTKSDQGFSLFTTNGQSLTSFAESNLHITKHNVLSSGTVFDIDERKVTFSGFDRDRSGLANGKNLVLFEDEENSLGGLVVLSDWTENEEKASFGGLTTELVRKGMSCLKGVGVHVEYETHYKNRDRVVETVLTPSIDWVVPLALPSADIDSVPKAFYLYGDCLYFTCAYVPKKEEDDSPTSPMIEDEEEDIDMKLGKEQPCTILTVCVDIKAGTLVWNNSFVSKQSMTRFIEIFPRSNSLFVKCVDANGEWSLHIMNLITGGMCYQTSNTLSDDGNPNTANIIFS